MKRLLTPLVVFLLVGCAATPATPAAPTGTTTAAMPATLSASPMSMPTSTETSMATPSDDQLAAEAETVLREFQKEWNAVGRSGATAPTSRMRELAADPMLSDISSLLNRDHDRGTRWDGDVVLFAVQRHGTAFPGAKVSLTACQDGRKVAVIEKSGARTKRGAMMQMTVYFKHVDGKLKAFDGENRKVEKCPA